MQPDTRDLRNRMQLIQTPPNDLRKLYLNYSQKLNHFTIRIKSQ